MEKSSQLGANRTGIDASPLDSKAMSDGIQKFHTTSGNANALHDLQRQYATDADPVGSVPIPGTPKGMLKSMMKKMSGNNPEMLVNKLGERLAFERSGVRVYETFITTCEALSPDGDTAGPDIPLSQLREFRDQEAEHFYLIKRSMEFLGADPTAQTPDADVSAVASSGMMKVISDPRTSIGQCLEVMLSLELTDNAAWDVLIKLAADLGLDDMAAEFGGALHQEERHAQHVRQWYETLVRGDAKMVH